MTTLREAARQALQALELGYDCAKAEADQYHAAMAGYRPQRHAQMDAEVQQIATAITTLRAALAEPDYASANPLGGPAVVFDAIARRLRSGEPYDEVLDDYGLQHASAEPVQDHFPDVTKMVQEPVHKCKKCSAYFERFSCGMKTIGECDCPKCQGYCECKYGIIS